MKITNYARTPNPTQAVSVFDKQADAKLNATVDSVLASAAAEALEFLNAPPSDAARSLRKAAAEASQAADTPA